MVLNEVDPLLDLLVSRNIYAPNSDLNWFLLAVAPCQLLYLLRPSSTPHQRLSVRSYLRQNLFNMRLESHILLHHQLLILLAFCRLRRVQDR